jgi:membrane-bound lytic murein transglycosylase B
MRLADHPGWLPPVLAGIPGQWRSTVESNTAAQIDLNALFTPLPHLQGVLIASPAPAATLLGYYKQAAAITGVPWQVLAAIHMVESKMSRIATTSGAGAQGPMQFLPATWASYGQGNINDNHDAILAAAHYLQAMGATGNLAVAIYHYNPSDNYVRAVLAYAAQMQADPSAFASYYHWQVVLGLDGHEVVLPVGYPRVPAIPAS